MSYVLHLHPLSSYCWKVLLAFYESGVPFEPAIVDLGAPATRDGYLRLSPMGKIPALEDRARGMVVNETSIIIEHLALNEPAARSLLPGMAEAALRVRHLDRFFDNYVMTPMQKIVLDKIRPPDSRDPFGVAQARRDLDQALDWLDAALDHPLAAGATFTLADCAAAPALYYADRVAALEPGHGATAAYLERLRTRPSFARVLSEAEPYFALFPGG